MSRNNVQHDAKNKSVKITIIIMLLFPNLRLVHWRIFSQDEKFLRMSAETPGHYLIAGCR